MQQPSPPASSCDSVSITPSLRETLFTTDTEGRRRHATSSAAYALPNDQPEMNRLNALHRIFWECCGERNYLCPLKELLLLRASPKTKKILDLGTGTGLWAIQMADEFPDCEVIGIDISPIQTEAVPKNCQFEVDDVSLGLCYPDADFTLVHSRLIIAVANWDAYVADIARLLTPGGIAYIIEPSGELYSPDSSMGPALQKWWLISEEASKKVKVTRTTGDKLSSLLRSNGKFRKVSEIRLHVPIGSFQPDRSAQVVGEFMRANFIDFMYTMLPLCKSAGYSREYLMQLIDEVKLELLDTRRKVFKVYVHCWATRI